MTGASERGIDRGEDDIPRGARAVRDEALAAVDDPVLSVFAAARANPGDVGSGARLGESVRAPFQAGRHVLEDAEEALLLFLRAASANWRSAEARSRETEK